MAEKFIEQDSKIFELTDEELGAISGGAATTYYSQPYQSSTGVMVVNTVTVSGGHTFDPATGTFSGLSSSGTHGSMVIAASKLDSYLERVTGRGNSVIALDIAGPLVK